MLMTAAVAVSLMLRLGLPVAAAPSNSLARYKPTQPPALAHFEAGNRSYKDARVTTRSLADRVRDLKRAIDEYNAGQAIDDAPAFDYNIAHCARLLIDNATAVAHLQRFLERADRLDAKLGEDVKREINELDPTGSIRAELRQASAPRPSNAPPVAAVESPPPAHPASTGQPAPPTAPPSIAPLQTSTSAGAAPHGSRAWVALGWGLTAAGVASGGVATWLAVNAAGLDRDSKDTSRTTSDRIALENRADSRRGAALIVGISGGAAVVLGVLTLLLPARSEARAAGSAWNLHVTGNGIAVAGRF